jgi:diguanylate cyclase (GGDEF)-like protein
MADLDHFKALNDTYGHEIGDRALRRFAEVLSDNVRGHDIVARVGGEEFVLVYPETDLDRAMEIIERIRAALALAISEAGLPAFTCSFGVASSSVAEDVDSIIRVADAGLLTAKEEGRDRVVHSDAALAARVFGHRAPSPPPPPLSDLPPPPDLDLLPPPPAMYEQAEGVAESQAPPPPGEPSP